MKKFFLIPLLACFTCVMAFATVHEVATFDQLRTAINNAAAGDEIQLTADIDYGTVEYGSNLNIKKSLTIDGQGHKLVGAGQRQSGNSQYATIWVNLNCTDSVAVTFKDIQIVNPNGLAATYAIQTRGLIKSLTLNNVFLQAYEVPLQIGGYQESKAKIQLDDCYLYTPKYYCLLSWNPYELVANNTKFEGWNALYFKGENGSTGSEGTVAVANNCKFNCPNYNSGTSNSFGMFVCEDDGVSITLNNCTMDAEQFGDQYQWILVLSEFALSKDRVQPVSLTINGDNTYINGLLLGNAWCTTSRWTLSPYEDHNDAVVPNPFPLSITISGGTYGFNPEEAWWYKNSTLDEPEKSAEANKGRIVIPEGYEVKAIETQQGATTTTLYRVRKAITEIVDINSGDNEEKEVKVETEGETTLTADTTIVKYLEVAGNEESETVVVKVEEDKTLEISNGLDVTGNAQVVISAGATVEIGEGGVISESSDNIVIESEEGKSAAFLLSPEVVVNTTPLATYKFKSKARFHSAEGIYTYQRFGVPTFDGLTTMTWEANVLTSLDRYSNEHRNWEHINPVAKGRYEIAGKPFQCYNMTIDTDTTDITYTFTGNLMGNQNTDLDFVAGWNCYANCYTAPINTASLLRQIDEKFGYGVNGAIYIYKRNEETNATDWEAITLGDFDLFGESYLEAHGVKEIAPMQAFILNLHEGEYAAGTISYVDNIYNPYKGITNPTPSFAPQAKNGNNTGVVLYVSDGTNSDKLTLYEKESLSDEFDNGYDADKFDNEFDFSVYCMLGETKLSALGTNSLADKKIAFDTKVAGEFTLSVEIAVGDPVILYDNVEEKTLELTTGASFTFSAEAINDPARFTINPSDATAIDNTEVVGTTSKFMKDGQLYIRRAGNVYTVQGQTIK